MPDDTVPNPSFSAARRWVIRLNVLLGVVAVISLLVMVNYLASGYYKRFHWTNQSRVQIAPQTENLLKSLTNQVDVVIFFDKEEADLYGWVSSLLKEYSYKNPKVTVRTVDYTRDNAEARSVAVKYKLDHQSKNCVIFESPSTGGTRIVYAKELADYDINALLAGEKEIRRTAFRGEMLFTSAIFSVTYPRKQKVFFVNGHGEHDIDDEKSNGYSKFAGMLRLEHNLEVQQGPLQGTNGLSPETCQLLVIAGPGRFQFTPLELERVETYLRQGGRMLVLLNNMAVQGVTGLESRLLTNWGVGVGNVRVEDKDFSQMGNGQDLLASQWDPSHPISKTMLGAKLGFLLFMPRPVGQLSSAPKGADAPTVTILSTTSPNATDGQQKGSFPLIAAVEHGSIKGITTDRHTRMVVVGDSMCLMNDVIAYGGNSHFATLSVNWLLERPQVMLEGLAPRPLHEYRLLLSHGSRRTLKWVLLGVLPGSLLLMGSLVWLRRRR